MKLSQLLENSDDQKVRNAIREARKNLDHEERHKDIEWNVHSKKFWYVTQEDCDYQHVADTIAKELATEGLDGWTVHVAVRDDWDGGYDDRTPWTTATSGASGARKEKPMWYIVSDDNFIEEGGWEDKVDADDAMEHYNYGREEVAYGIISGKDGRTLRRMTPPTQSPAPSHAGKKKEYEPDTFHSGDDIMKKTKDLFR